MTVRVRGADGRFKSARAAMLLPARPPAFGEQAKRCRALPCLVCEKLGKRQTRPTEAHHEPRQRDGGTDLDTLPLCESHHRQRHRMCGRDPSRFWTFHGIDWRAAIVRMRNPIPPAPGDFGAIPI